MAFEQRLLLPLVLLRITGPLLLLLHLTPSLAFAGCAAAAAAAARQYRRFHLIISSNQTWLRADVDHRAGGAR